ncbi:MAG: YicC family protein [Deltaproteobacteria bacterium]|jgi:uncharacterized protein (TIGR00255 family)|nr:YicC family protein [Deltaproteobacteria bacterium]
MNSMTGYGTIEGKVGKGRLFIEIKSVNHRFNEVNVKIPGRMSVLEALIRKHLQKKFTRGKFDVYFKEKEPLFGGVRISINKELASKYQNTLKKLKKELRLKNEIDFFSTVGLDRIIKIEEKGGSYVKLWGQISKLIDNVSTQVAKMRAKEGVFIKRDQVKRLNIVSSLVKQVQRRSKSVRGAHMERIRSKINGELGQTEVDEQRLQMEAAYLGGRQDIAEELVRLASHTQQYKDLVRSNGAVGRKLDFLLQEMNREANTIGAKASDANISQMIVDCKAELERLREQVQNAE